MLPTLMIDSRLRHCNCPQRLQLHPDKLRCSSSEPARKCLKPTSDNSRLWLRIRWLQAKSTLCPRHTLRVCAKGETLHGQVWSVEVAKSANEMGEIAWRAAGTTTLKPHLEVGKQRVAAPLMIRVAHGVIHRDAADVSAEICTWQVCWDSTRRRSRHSHECGTGHRLGRRVAEQRAHCTRAAAADSAGTAG